MRDVVILGSTGSIGTQALEVVAEHRDQFQVVGLAGWGQQIALLARQALDSGARTVAGSAGRQPCRISSWRFTPRQADVAGRREVRRCRASSAGPDAAAELAAMPCDVVLNGITGSTGLAATLAVLRAGRILALANKESLVVGGRAGHQSRTSRSDCCRRLRTLGAGAMPSRWLCGGGRSAHSHRKRRTLPWTQPRTDEQCHSGSGLWHTRPGTWAGVITTNSATLVNKGLELLEAHLLYGVDLDRIDVVVHPQSIDALHGAVRRRLDARAVFATRHEASDCAGSELA